MDLCKTRVKQQNYCNYRTELARTEYRFRLSNSVLFLIDDDER